MVLMKSIYPSNKDFLRARSPKSPLLSLDWSFCAGSTACCAVSCTGLISADVSCSVSADANTNSAQTNKPENHILLCIGGTASYDT